MSNLPHPLDEKADEQEVGARHGDVTGAWRVVRNGALIAAVALFGIWLVYA